MTAETALQQGHLDEALKLLTQDVRHNPADAKLRVFLFQLLALRGDWERAQTQLGVVGELDPVNTLMVTTYTALLRSEAVRAGVFAGQRNPVVIGEPEPWLALLFQALALDARGSHAQAMPLRTQALDQAEARGGRIDGEAFEWLADADMRFGPCLEVVLESGYAWVPFTRLSKLAFEPPTDLRDKIWLPAHLTWTNGGEAVGFVPVRYPGFEHEDDDDFALARKTDWVNVAPDVDVGRGQRTLATDAGDYPLLDVRTIEFESA